MMEISNDGKDTVHAVFYTAIILDLLIQFTFQFFIS